MHADYLGITVPLDRADEVLKHIQDFTASLGGYSVTPELIRLGDGTIKIYERGRVLVTSFSGGVLQVLRDSGSLSEFLFPFANGAHKITRLHIAYDLFVEARPMLRRMVKLGRKGNLKLSPNTRRPLQPKHVTYVERHNYSEPDTTTGTVYLGSEKAEIRLVGYDKRNERIDRGLPDPGHPWFRAELRLTDKMKPSLRDVVEPDSMFWHFAQSVLKRPDGISEWQGMAEHYQLEKPRELLPYELMKRRVESSPDIDHLIDLSVRMGPEGYTALLRLLESKRRTITGQLKDSDEAA